MQRVTLVRYATKPDRADENEALVRAVFKELRATAPDHIAYALFRNGVNFVHIFINKTSPDASALVELPSFKVFSEGGSERWEAPPEQIRLNVNLVDSYGLK